MLLALRAALQIKFAEYTFRNCLENRDGSQNGGSEGGQEGANGPQSAAFRRQRNTVQRPSAIFQTVSPRTRLNRQ
jgi:hypothetical protein